MNHVHPDTDFAASPEPRGCTMPQQANFTMCDVSYLKEVSFKRKLSKSKLQAVGTPCVQSI